MLTTKVLVPDKGRREARSTFLRRFLWRDLAYYMLWTFPQMPVTSVRVFYETEKWTAL